MVYKNSTEILNKLKTKGFQASTISTYDFSTLYTTLPHNLIRNQLVDLIENTFRHEEALYLACNEERAFFASEEHKKYDLWSCQKVTDALIYLLDNIYIRFGSKLYRQNVGIPMGTNCAPLVADLLLFCYERDFMKSLTKEKRYDLIDAFNSTSRYLDDLLNIDNIHFEHMVHRIYPAELQLNKANASDTEAAFLDLNLSIHNDIVSTKIYDKRDDFNFDIVNFPFLDGDVPQRISYGVYIARSQGSRSRDPHRYKPGKKGWMCVPSLGHFSFYQLTYRRDGTGADETTEHMSGLDGYGRNARQSDTNIKYAK